MSINRKNIDIIELMLFPLIAATISYGLQLNMLWSIFLFFGLPSIYLSIRHPKYIKRSLAFSLLISLPANIMADYIAHRNGLWWVPTIFPMRIFGLVPIEDLIFGFFNFYVVLMYYQTFLDKKYSKAILPKYMIDAFVILLIGMAVFMSLYFLKPSLLDIPYFYFGFGFLVFFIPVLIHLLKHPQYSSKFFYSGLYFFYLTLTYEITALIMGWWEFNHPQVIGWVTVWRVTFPLEELLFWIVLSSLTIITAFEKYEEGVA